MSQLFLADCLEIIVYMCLYLFLLRLTKFVKTFWFLHPVSGGGPIGPEPSVQNQRLRANRSGSLLRKVCSNTFMCLCSFTISKTFQKKLTRSQPCFNNSGTLSARSHVLLQLFLFFRASRSFAKTGFSFPVFSSLFFVSVFHFVLGAFWDPFWLVFEIFFDTFPHRFSR